MDNDHVDMIIGHGIMSYLENLRESNVKRISRNAMKFVNEVNVASLLDGAWWMFDEQ
jgi:tetrahydromethanopterin S-methyltransferase subunit A